MHELGHLLGREHSDSQGLMDPLLPLGTRRSLDEAADEHGLETRALDEIFASLGAREE